MITQEASAFMVAVGGRARDEIAALANRVKQAAASRPIGAEAAVTQ